jgi:hypothetical protein
MSTIVEALKTRGGSNAQGGGRLADIADELEWLHQELDAAIATIKSLPDVDTKQPHSHAAGQLIQRIDALYIQANEIDAEKRPGLPWLYVTPMATCPTNPLFAG